MSSSAVVKSGNSAIGDNVIQCKTINGALVTDITTEIANKAALNKSPLIKQAVIMAGGKGTRLYPYTASIPKPLVPLGDMPILELLLRRLKAAGVTDVILAVNHLRHLIEAYFRDGSQFGLNITYHIEEQPLGTAGALAGMVDELHDNFFLTNGDLLTTLDLQDMMHFHANAEADASVGISKRDMKIDFGLIEIDENNRMAAYKEKPSSSYNVSMGIYILQRDAIRNHVVYNNYLDMPDLLLKMKAAGANVSCYSNESVWLDIGRPDDFAKAQELFETDRELFLAAEAAE